YFSNVIPSQTSAVTLPFYFPFTRAYWTSGASQGTLPRLEHLGTTAATVVKDDPPADAVVGISVIGLGKTFKHPKTSRVQHAVRELSLDAYEGQTLALLGKNGAGKSTLISMLTGLIPATYGTALIRGTPILESRAARKPSPSDTLGICPQHDVLWDKLTVRQHLELFAGLKGVPAREIAAVTTDAIVRCDLEEKGHAFVETLSGGQKRKLSVGIAYIGGSRTIILDEPTSGMDPLSRRAIWDIVNREKQGRTVIFTTHFMDEAEYLGDRIAILASGQLKATGTTLFLKRTYGVGYSMTVMRSDSERSATEVSEIVRSHLPDATAIGASGSESTFSLPTAGRAWFPALLRDLDGERGQGAGVRTYGLSVTSLEEVFLRIVSEEEEAQAADENTLEVSAKFSPSQGGSATDLFELNDLESERKFDTGAAAVEGGAGFIRQVVVLFLKLFRLNVREPGIMIARLVLPIIVTIFAAWLMRNSDGTCYPPPVQPAIPLEWAARDIYLPESPFLVSPSNFPFAVVEPNATAPQFTNSLATFNSLADESQLAGALLLPTLSANASVSTWDGSYIASQASLVGDVVTQSAVINLADNAFIDVRESKSGHQISTVFHRFDSPFAEDNEDGSVFGAVFALVTIYAIIPALSTSAIVKEKLWKAKHQQRVSGARPLAYWVSYLLWDGLNVVVIAVVAAITFRAAGTPMLSDHIIVVFGAIVLNGLASITMSYALSPRFDTPAGANGGLIAMFAGLGLFYVLVLLELVYQLRSAQSTIDIVGTVFTAYVPSAGFIHILFSVANFGPLRCARVTYELRTVGDATWYIFVALAAQVVVFFAWTVWRDSRSSASAGSAQAKGEDPEGLLRSDADPDVVAEAARVDAGGANSDAAVIRHLRKRYPPNADGREKIAVRNLSLGVPVGQCFALLGPNGAGKTTALSILAGEQLPSSGDCIVDGHSVLSDLAGVQASIGVTPQFDALLTQHLSGGNKRKTSVGIAVVGKPPCLMLDEPSTGMDPASKRSMWDVISALRKEHAIILTTHSMEEASSICNRIQHLRDRYGTGYQLEIQTRTDDTNLARSFVTQAFPGAVLLEYQRRHLRYAFPPESVESIADVFEAIEASRDAAGIDDYSLGQTSLEQ
ncbi:P-loop containing nucleoside triphosphate hydrolase protein, partial [Blyttiomyces helicus]